MSATPDIESTPPAAVSSLRSRFEKLAADISPVIPQRPPSSHAFLAPEPASPRPRAVSSADESKQRCDSPALRPAVSSSDLKAVKRPPPPPPPPARSPRATSPAPPSPRLLRAPDQPPIPEISLSPEHTSLPAKTSLIARKPPPPPLPPHHPGPECGSAKVEPATLHKSSDIPSLINLFGNTPPPIPSTSRPTHYPTRVVSHTMASIVVTSDGRPDSPDSSRRPRHSFPFSGVPSASSSSSSISSVSSSSTFKTQDPFGDDLLESESIVFADPSPPPLPSRKNGAGHDGHGAHSEHHRSSTSDSTYSSESSSETDVNETHIPSPASATLPPRPPRPPPRPRAIPPPGAGASGLSSAASLAPPPLPARKSTFQEDTSPRPPPPPPRPSMPDVDSQPHAGPSSASSSSVSPSERKAFGAHPPPPTRTIGLGDKLPPARRAHSGSSSESEDDDAKKVELLPDTSRASRRPPTIDCHNYSEFNIHIPAYTGVIAVSGHTVAVATHHHLKIYDLSISDAPVWNLDSKDLGLDKLNGFKVTSMEFRPAAKAEDRGSFLWLGTKDGHLLELDIRTGAVVGVKPVVHAHMVTHMFRHARSMMTMDDTGKVLVFTPDPGSGEDIRLAYTSPRIVRIADRQEFAKVIGAQLWTSTRDPTNGGGTASNSRGPIVRVYDVFTPGSTGKSLLPTEHLGAVTSGTILPTQPDHVYLGHEGGHVSIWSRAANDGVPQCQEVIKVSASDVMSLEGVNNRLWSGGRNGMIAAYDVVPRPWAVTNRWAAHTKLPVLKLAVDTWSIEKLNRLMVYSIGRDEKLRFWDGLLGIDWVDQELLKRETEFSSFRDMNVLIVSWNVDSAKPDALTGYPENVNFLHDVLTSVEVPDIIAFGLQELIDLESRKMAAKTVLLGGKNKTSDGAISQKVTTSYKKWYDRLVSAVRQAMPPDAPYTVIHTENLVGLFSCIFVKNTERISLKHVSITTIKRGMGGRYGNKGGIVARFVIDDTSICFINCHLAAGQHHVRQRNADVAAIVEDKSVFPESDALQGPLAYVDGGDGSMVLDHEIVFINGDMNYRIDQRRDVVVSAIKAGDLESLQIHDQLLKEMKFNRGFRLRSFLEGRITFVPTYKYDRRSSEYDSSEKSRVPAWCDRVLWRSRDPSRVQQLHYQRYEANISDHRPISAAFRMTVKSVHHEAREKIKAEVRAAWMDHEQVLLQAAQQFFVDQAMV